MRCICFLSLDLKSAPGSSMIYYYGECWCECKNSIKHKCKQDYAYNPPTCACECDKNCDIDEYFKNCACE